MLQLVDALSDSSHIIYHYLCHENRHQHTHLHDNLCRGSISLLRYQILLRYQRSHVSWRD